MRPSEWVKERIESTAHHHKLVWVEDPYRLLDREDVAELQRSLDQIGHSLIVVTNAFRLRESLASIEGTSTAHKVVVIDQSYNIRDSHLLPKDAKPSDLKPIPAPDWKPRVHVDARFRPTIRDFLASATGVDDWPAEVNIYPYEKLARVCPADFVTAYETFRRTGQALTSEVLAVVGASAVMGVDLFNITNPVLALELAFHAGDRWSEVSEYFNAREQEVIRNHLRELSSPLGELFSDEAEAARNAVVALLILKQHFQDTPGKQLPYLSPALSAYRSYDVLPPLEAPPWFVEEEVPRFESLCSNEFLQHLRDQLELDHVENARAFAQRERYSKKLRSLVPFEVDAQPEHAADGEDFRLEHLVPEFLQLKSELEDIVNFTKGSIGNLRLTPLKNQTAQRILEIFVDRGFYRVDRLLGRLDSLIYFIEGPARRQWQTIAGFESRWQDEQRTCRDAMTAARRLKDDLDMAFGRLLEGRYSDIVPGEILPADLFYQEFIGPHRRTNTRHPKKAVVLLIDSMRLDLWRELLRPALEQDYEVEEKLGFALLPSETTVSRKAFFAGKPPASLPSSGRETDMFGALVSSFHGTKVDLKELTKRRPGMAFGATAKDGSLRVVVFNFPDVLTHKVDWDPHTLQESQRHLLTEIRALLEEVGSDALVFVTADHGHILQKRGAPVWIDSADVGYRSAYLSNRVEGNDAAHVFQIPAKTLRHSGTGWYVFPRPGYALRSSSERSRRFRPTANYRHGGMSLFEVVVPIVCLKHRTARAQVCLVPRLPKSITAGQTSTIEISVSADSVLASPVSLISDQTAIEATVVSGVTPTPKIVKTRFLPSAPGRHTVCITAQMAGEKVGEASFNVQVSAAVAEPDAARAKLNKLFGDD